MPLQMFQPKKTNDLKYVIGIAAGKGGVGKSSVTVNLALALKNLGCSVGILDADVYGPSIRKMLPPDLLPGMEGEKLIPALSNGIKVISMAYFRKDGEASAVRAPIANSLIQQFLNGVIWGKLDFLLIDFPPGTGDVQLTLAQKANLTAAIMVTTPQEVALIDVRKAMHFFEQVKVPFLGIVENMSFYLDENGKQQFIFGNGGGKELASEKGLPLLGEIPLDPFIGACHDKGLSLFSKSEGAGASTIFLQLAKKVSQHCEVLTEQKKDSLADFEIVWRDMQ